MDISTLKIRESEKGFTLVELAVVMIIIGVLIGGVLKGQEMVENARVTAAAGDLERFGAAYNSFLDIYSVQPGDMNNANARLADCAVYLACGNAGGATAANGVINANVGAAAAAGEGLLFWGHLLAAGLISGMDGNNAGGAPAISVTNPTSPVGGGYFVGDIRAGIQANTFPGANMRARPHIVLNAATAAVGAATGPITGSQASAIDTRLDDGNPQVGTVVGVTQANSCVTAAADTTYTGANNSCAMAYRM